jgi:putative sugar O-methyltransferase
VLIDKIKKKYFLLKHFLNATNNVPTDDVNLQILKRKIKKMNVFLFPETTSWDRNRKELRENILRKDISKFLDWNVVKRTMVFEAPKIEYSKVNENKVLSVSIKESSVGKPLPYFLDSSTSGNLVHHAYSLSMLLERLELNNVERVVELGGGYGSMCRLFRNIGYLKEYTIFDLPEFSALQEYYLNSVNSEFTKNTVLTTNIDDLEGNNESTLIVATWSLSEMPLSLREVLFEKLKFNYCIIAFQAEFDGIDNISYFSQFNKRFKGLRFQLIPINHLTDNYYLIGIKK